MSQEADLTGQQMVPSQDHWKLVALVLPQILYRVVAKFLKYRWHSLVEEPQRCAGICMTSPLDRELRLLSDFPARRLTQSFSTPSASSFQGDRYKGVGVCDGGVLHPL